MIDYFSSSPEAIVKELICQNRGTQSFILIKDLYNLGEARGLKIEKKNLSKVELYDLISTKYSAEELAAIGHVGISSWYWQKKFGITNNDVRRMADKGFIAVTGKERFRAYGDYQYANLYSVFDFCRLTTDEVGEWLKEHKKRHSSKQNC